MIGVSIIGIGRVGGAIALGLPAAEYRIENLVYRGETDVRSIASVLDREVSVSRLEEIERLESEIIVITTQDAEIRAVARALVGRVNASSTVFHTSGAMSSAVLSDLQADVRSTGSIHPLVSVSRPDIGPSRFAGAFFCVEGDAGAVEMGRKIVADLGGRAFSIETKFKTLYHAAAVTACGHLVALIDASVEIMTKCGLSDNDAKNILLPLVTSTVQNLSEQSTAAALTGTFARADIETFTQHLITLNEHVPETLLEIYLLLGERSLELAAKQGVSAERIERLRTKVAIAKSKLKW